MMNDIRSAIRQIARRPGLTAIIVTTLALGIGANTAIFSVVQGVLLRPLPYPDPERLVAVWESNSGEGWSDRNNVTDGNYVDWGSRNTVFESIGAYSQSFGVAAMGVDNPVEVMSTRLSPSMFQVLGARAMLGRVFQRSDGLPGGDAVALLSHVVWSDRFGADSAIVGRVIQLEEQPATVIGVMPPSFEFPNPDIGVWIPLRVDPAGNLNRQAHKWRVVARLKPGVPVDAAQAEMDVIATQLRREHPDAMAGWGVTVTPLHGDMVRAVKPLLLILLSAVGLLLLITAANVANLLLARAIQREREFAVRSALGGTRARIIRQLFVEAALCSLLGVAGGVLLAAWGVQLLIALAPADIPLMDQVRIDGVVLAYAIAAGVVSTLLFGLAPAWRASRTDIESSLRPARSSGSARHSRFRTALLVGELALSLVLLVGAGLLVRSFLALQRVGHGFDPDRLMAVGINLPYARYDGTPEHAVFAARAIEGLSAIPGVVGVAATAEPPMIGFYNTFSFVVEGRRSEQPDGEESPVPVRPVTPEYFATMDIPVVAGRAITPFDREGQPRVVIVNESFARRFWGSAQRAVGQRLSFDDHAGPWIEIVGVVGDTKHFGLDQPTEPAMYMPYAQKRWGWMSWMTFMVRTRPDPLEIAPEIRQAVWRLDDRLPIRELATVESLYAESSARRRFAAVLVVAFAGAAVFLGLFGVYGVVSYSVSQREREFGVRLALGAEGKRLVLGVLIEGFALALAGAVLGVAGALALTRLIAGLLFGITPADPMTFVVTTVLLLVVTVAASWIPARRAARVHPMEALRAD